MWPIQKGALEIQGKKIPGHKLAHGRGPCYKDGCEPINLLSGNFVMDEKYRQFRFDIAKQTNQSAFDYSLKING
jgi:hypothetical protein